MTIECNLLNGDMLTYRQPYHELGGDCFTPRKRLGQAVSYVERLQSYGTAKVEALVYHQISNFNAGGLKQPPKWPVEGIIMLLQSIPLVNGI